MPPWKTSPHHPAFGHLLLKEKGNGQGFIWSVATKAQSLLPKLVSKKLLACSKALCLLYQSSLLCASSENN
jgi:hypothetical protein